MRQYLGKETHKAHSFPVSMEKCFKPLPAPDIPLASNVFPNNVSFVTVSGCHDDTVQSQDARRTRATPSKNVFPENVSFVTVSGCQDDGMPCQL